MTADTAGISGIVLAGGASSRMGEDKANLLLSGQALLDRAVELLHAVVADVFVGVARHQASDPVRSRHRLILDDPGLTGPAAALLAAHRHNPRTAWLVIGCDMPGLTVELLEVLVASRDSSSNATAFEFDGALEPLCAIYEPDNLARLAAMAGDGSSPGPAALLSGVPVCVIVAPPGADLASANSPDDLALWRGRAVQ